MYDPTVARLTYRALLGRRPALILGALPALLILISVIVRALVGAGLHFAVVLRLVRDT